MEGRGRRVAAGGGKSKWGGVRECGFVRSRGAEKEYSSSSRWRQCMLNGLILQVSDKRRKEVGGGGEGVRGGGYLKHRPTKRQR